MPNVGSVFKTPPERLSVISPSPIPRILMLSVGRHPMATTTPNQKPIGFIPLGVFFFFGATMAAYAAFTLGFPGTLLDRAWVLNKTGHVQLAAMGRIMAAPFAVLAAVLLLAGIGWFRRGYWGWVLGVSVITVNLAGDLVRMILGDFWKSAVGVLIAGLLLLYMTRAEVGAYFRAQQH